MHEGSLFSCTHRHKPVLFGRHRLGAICRQLAPPPTNRFPISWSPQYRNDTQKETLQTKTRKIMATQSKASKRESNVLV